jgi:hypothetical protein
MGTGTRDRHGRMIAEGSGRVTRQGATAKKKSCRDRNHGASRFHDVSPFLDSFLVFRATG